MSENVFAAEKIIKKRLRKNKIEYLVKWKDWSLKHCTWEPSENILDQNLIRLFDEKDPHHVWGGARKRGRKRKRIISSQLPVVDRGEVLFNNTESFVESSASATESRLGDPDPANCSPDIYSSSISRGILPGASTSEQPRMYNLKRRYKRKKWGPLRGRARNSRSASTASFRPRNFNAIPHNEVKTPKETLDPDWTKKELVVTDVTTDSFMVTFIECEDADTLFGVPE